MKKIIALINEKKIKSELIDVGNEVVTQLSDKLARKIPVSELTKLDEMTASEFYHLFTVRYAGLKLNPGRKFGGYLESATILKNFNEDIKSWVFEVGGYLFYVVIDLKRNQIVGLTYLELR